MKIAKNKSFIVIASIIFSIMLLTACVTEIRGGKMRSFAKDEVIGIWISDGILFDEYIKVSKYNENNNADYCETLMLNSDGTAAFFYKLNDEVFTDENAKWKMGDEDKIVYVDLSKKFHDMEQISLAGYDYKDASDSLSLCRIFDENDESSNCPMIYFTKE